MFLGAYVEKDDRPRAARLGRRVPRARRHPPDGHRDDARRAPRRRLPHPPRVRLLDARSWSTSPPATSTPRACTCSRPAGCSTTPSEHAGHGGTAIMATETGMLHPLRMAAPDVDFIAANERASCRYMKMITLPKLRDGLRDLSGEVKVARGDRRAGAGADRAHGRDRLATRRAQPRAASSRGAGTRAASRAAARPDAPYLRSMTKHGTALMPALWAVRSSSRTSSA